MPKSTSWTAAQAVCSGVNRGLVRGIGYTLDLTTISRKGSCLLAEFVVAELEEWMADNRTVSDDVAKALTAAINAQGHAYQFAVMQQILRARQELASDWDFRVA